MHKSPFYQPCMLVESEAIHFFKKTDFVLSIVLYLFATCFQMSLHVYSALKGVPKKLFELLNFCKKFLFLSLPSPFFFPSPLYFSFLSLINTQTRTHACVYTYTHRHTYIDTHAQERGGKESAFLT